MPESPPIVGSIQTLCLVAEQDSLGSFGIKTLNGYQPDRLH